MIRNIVGLYLRDTWKPPALGPSRMAGDRVTQTSPCPQKVDDLLRAWREGMKSAAPLRNRRSRVGTGLPAGCGCPPGARTQELLDHLWKLHRAGLPLLSLAWRPSKHQMEPLPCVKLGPGQGILTQSLCCQAMFSLSFTLAISGTEQEMHSGCLHVIGYTHCLS